MLDIVENYLLKKHEPAVSYLRLDGSVSPSSRHHIVTKFNSDPSIDVLLLTTQIILFFYSDLVLGFNFSHFLLSTSGRWLRFESHWS